jgi:hypothetical protein
MGFLGDKLVGEYEGSKIEVRAENHVLRGLIYKLFVDGEVVADAQNFFKIPTERTLEGDVMIGGARRHLVLVVHQRMLRADYALTVDGESVDLSQIG